MPRLTIASSTNALCLSASLCAVVVAHDHDPVWAESPASIIVHTTGPTAVRGDGEAWINVHVLNLTDEPARVLATTLLRDGLPIAGDDAHAALPSVAKPVEAWRSGDLALDDPVARTRARLHAQTVSLIQIRDATVRRVLRPGAELDGSWSIMVEIETTKGIEIIEQRVSFTRSRALPTGNAEAQRFVLRDSDGVWIQDTTDAPHRTGDSLWKAGDQHLHTAFSIDAYVLDGTDEDPAQYADAARAIGLDWISISDHSNVHGSWFGTEFYTSDQHAYATAQAAAYRSAEQWPLLYGQEMGLGQIGFWDLPSHMLAIPLDTFSQPFIDNPSSGQIYNVANCEPEQVIIDRINASGSYGFIAHPFHSTTLAVGEWDWGNGATGWAGLELWSNAEGLFTEEDLEAVVHWHTRLSAISPVNGSLPERAGWPNGAPVGLGNSDAHTPGDIGRIFTYARLDAITPNTLREALLGARCVVSDGPLVTIEVNHVAIGDVAILPEGRGRAVLRIESTPEFGTINQFTVGFQINGDTVRYMPTQSVTGYAAVFIMESSVLFLDGGYCTVWAQRTDLARLALTNPVWLQHAGPGDVDGNGIVNVLDLLALFDSFGDCLGCAADTNGDGVVDITDLLTLLAAYSG